MKTLTVKQVKTALKELLKRERAISSPGAISKDYKTVGALITKYNTEGLTMSEINQVKRLYYQTFYELTTYPQT